MAGENDPRKDQENGEISQRNGNLHAPPIDDITESDEENSGDENERSGYEPLPQNDIPNLQEDGDESEEEENNQTLDDILRQIPPSYTSPQVQDMIEESQRTQDREIVQEREALFNQLPTTALQPPNSQTTPDMSKDQVETIRSAMAGFQLPTSSIPPWASNLSEEEFQKKLQDKLSSRKKH